MNQHFFCSLNDFRDISSAHLQVDALYIFPDLEIFGLTLLEDLPPEKDTITKLAWEKFGYPCVSKKEDNWHFVRGGERVRIFGKFLVKGWEGTHFCQGERRNGVK
jgi:hypothetical protein